MVSFSNSVPVWVSIGTADDRSEAAFRADVMCAELAAPLWLKSTVLVSDLRASGKGLVPEVILGEDVTERPQVRSSVVVQELSSDEGMPA